MPGTIEDAVWGAVVGATIGAPRRGANGERKHVFYDPVPARMAPHDALDAWLVWAECLRRQVPIENLAGPFHWHLRFPVEETAFAAANFEEGFVAPMSGWLRNPLGDGSQGLGRAVIWGLTAPTAAEAVRSAFWDASLDHFADGAVCPALLAALVFLARQGSAWSDALQWVRLVTPPGSHAARGLAIGQTTWEDGKDASALNVRLREAGFVDEGYHAAATLARIVFDVSACQGKPEQAVCLAAELGQNADDVGLAAGALACLAHGPMPDEWLSPLGSIFVAGHRLTDIEQPSEIHAFAKQIASLAKPIEPAATEPKELLALFAGKPNRQARRIGSVLATASYDPILRSDNESVEVVVTLSQSSGEVKATTANLQAPEGCEMASRVQDCRLLPGQDVHFPAVLRSDHAMNVAQATLTVDDGSMALPLLRAEQWWICGPFDNNADDGLDRVLKCEDVLGADEVFMGRSRIPVRWEPLAWSGNFDVEARMQGMPGVIVLGARLHFRQTGELKVVASGSPGVQVTVNRQRVVRYRDTHRPVPRAISPYVGRFTVCTENLVLIRLSRHKVPAESFTLYWLGEAGQIVRPLSHLSLAGTS